MNTDCPETTAARPSAGGPAGNPANNNFGRVFLSYARGLFDYLREHGHGLAPLLADTGLSEADFEDAERSMPTTLYVELWRRAVELTGDDCLGLHVGEVVRPGKYGILGYAMMSCETLEEALLRQKRYQDLVGKAGRSEFVLEGAHAELRWYSDMARLSRQVGEEHVASWVAFARWMLGPDRNPEQVLFEHPQPRKTREHQRIFGCELRFNQPYTAIVFPASLLSSPIRDKDPAVKRLMDSYAENLLAERGRAASDPAQDIRDSIGRSLVNGVPSIEILAEQMKVHTRTLQRRLSDMGLNYKQLLDDVRCSLALQHLKDPKLGLLDIAFLLGFAEQSSFQRAFKRWTGQSPGHYRGGKKPS